MTAPGIPGRWINPGDDYGFHLRQVKAGGWFRRSIYEFWLEPAHPLTWHDDRGYWQCNRRQARTDLGSVPPPFNLIWPPDGFLGPYCYHDQGCRHGGLYFSVDPTGPYVFQAVPRRDMDAFMFRWVEADGGRVSRWPLYGGVRVGAWFGIGRREVR